MKHIRYLIMIIAALAAMSFIWQSNITAVSMKVTSRILNNSRYITSSGVVGYKTSGGMMVTHFLSPSESWWFINAKGELKIYDPAANTVVVEPASGITSQGGYMYHFLTGQTGDMGLRTMGFSVSDTRYENGLVITTWMPPSVMAGLMGKVELVHENYRPVYTGWYNMTGECALKAYYSNFTTVSGIVFPQSVTEIRFRSASDSTIEKKVYSDIRINEAADQDVFKFTIPANARIISR